MFRVLGFLVWGLGFGIQGLEFGVEGSRRRLTGARQWPQRPRCPQRRGRGGKRAVGV